MFSLPLSIYPENRHRHLFFSNVIYPAAMVPVPCGMPGYDKLPSVTEQTAPTDLSLQRNDTRSDEHNAEEETTELAKSKLKFGIDKILHDKGRRDNANECTGKWLVGISLIIIKLFGICSH